MKSPVLIEWVDSSTIARGGWTNLDNVAPNACCTIVSVGWIAREDKESVVLLSDESNGGQIGRVLAIPKACIVKTKKLKL